MHTSNVNIYHDATAALTRISVALQLLEQHAPLSEQQRQFVNAALQGVADLDTILRDGAYRRVGKQPPVTDNN